MSETLAGALMHRWRWAAAIWVLAGLFDASQTVLIMHAEGNHHPWPPLFAVEFASWLPWSLATPMIVTVARRYPLARGASASAVGVHLATFAAVAGVSEAWNAALQVAFDPWGHRHPPTFLNTWATNLLYQSLTFLTAYALILTATFLVDSRVHLARQTTEAARLNEELSKARLAALLQQMEPHFIHNALNSITALVRKRRHGAAVDMLVGLSEFLRRASDAPHRAEAPLREEVEYLRRYIEIQKVRFGERLQVNIDIPESLLDVSVPNLLLQPLAENAIKHGIAERVAGGELHVEGVRRDGALVLRVRNDAPAVACDLDGSRTGVGLGNLRTRLQLLHGENADLVLSRLPTSQVEVTVTLPLEEA